MRVTKDRLVLRSNQGGPLIVVPKGARVSRDEAGWYWVEPWDKWSREDTRVTHYGLRIDAEDTEEKNG